MIAGSVRPAAAAIKHANVSDRRKILRKGINITKEINIGY